MADDGLPAAKMIYRTPDDARKALDFGIKKATEVLLQAGCYETFETETLREAGFHLMGTTRMGNDPDTSVINGWCESHDVKGLFVIDGGAFVTGAASQSNEYNSGDFIENCRLYPEAKKSIKLFLVLKKFRTIEIFEFLVFQSNGFR